MRPSTACVACRNRRRKCEVSAPGAPCNWCRHKNLLCSILSPSAFNGLWSNPSAEVSPKPSSDYDQDRAMSLGVQLPPMQLCLELVDLYFRYIHDLFHSLFHRPSLMQDVIDGTIPKVILFAIISLSARFSDDPMFVGIDPRLRGRQYAQAAQDLLDLREVSLSTIQACVLLGAFAITEGEASTEAVFYGIACRNALLLDLPNLQASSPVEKEVNRRAWWTLCMIDVWSSNGVRIPRALTPRSEVPYPMEETVFLRLRRDGTTAPNDHLPDPTTMQMQESESSLLTQMVKLNAILVEISTVNQMAAAAFAHSPGVNDFNHQGAVEKLARSLDEWHESLPVDLRDTDANMKRHTSMGLGPMFVAVWVGYYHYGQLLYYPYLHEDSYDDDDDDDVGVDDKDAVFRAPASTAARYYANKCKASAIGLCELLYRAYSTPWCEVYYTMVGHVLVIASTVQLHTLLFGVDDAQIRSARGRLEQNFEILTKLQTYWPTLDVCFTRFREFHKACQNYKQTSFRMDRWMLQFLFEFAKPVREKDPDDLAELRPWSMKELGFSPF
ncbi:hypothetical protein LTS17_004016 [Exophiala oligosperma]